MLGGKRPQGPLGERRDRNHTLGLRTQRPEVFAWARGVTYAGWSQGAGEGRCFSVALATRAVESKLSKIIKGSRA